jgi:hypothetical protein
MKDYIGKKYNKLTIVNESEPYFKKNGSMFTTVICQCECGNITERIRFDFIIKGNVKSCGCIRKETEKKVINIIKDKFVTINNETEHTNVTYISYDLTIVHKYTFESFKNMIHRCLYPSCKSYRFYGGKGITICKRWNNFKNFLSDMGERPEGLVLERINPKKNYKPSNCRWSKPKGRPKNI